MAADRRHRRSGIGPRFDGITLEAWRRAQAKADEPRPPVSPRQADPLEELGPYVKTSAEDRLRAAYEPTDFEAECETIKPVGAQVQRRTCIEHDRRDCLCDVDLTKAPAHGIARGWATEEMADMVAVASNESGHGRDPYVFFQHLSALLLKTDPDERRREWQRQKRSKGYWAELREAVQ